MTTHTDNYPKSLYHVHVRLARPTELPNLNAGRYILTCASRYAADDFFRATASLYGLTRLSPQLWTYTVGGETGLHNIQKDPNVPFDVKAPVLINWLANGDIRIALSLGVAATGRDWISGHWYYIRNMREKDSYWYVGSGGQVMASRRRKTRFLVEVVRPARAAEQGPVYLVRADRIKISTQAAGGRGEVVVRRGGGGRVVCVVAGDIQERGEGEFVFGDLLGGFSTGWASEEEDAVEHVAWVESGVYGDDWELC